MASSPIYNWPEPDNSDLVKNGALAMRTLGDAIDTTMATMTPKSIVDAKGDLIAASAADTPARLAVGADGETLVADSSTSTGLRYQGNYAAGKNKLINANMLIDQRNSGAAVTINAGNIYSVDRWRGFGQAADGVFTLQQDSSAPAGFEKSLKATVTTADASIGSTQSYSLIQSIEGFNCADLNYGSANAQTVTVSFWVRSSLTGTFGASLRNGAPDRSYPFSYSISVADTWEKKTATIAGDTTGTWLKDSSTGLSLSFGLGQGTDRAGTAGAWAAANYIGVTGQVQVIETLSATWYVTGVQLEIGNVATAFQTATGTIQGELAACQRYYWRASGANGINSQLGSGLCLTSGAGRFNVSLPVTMRTAPTVLDWSSINVGNISSTQALTSLTFVGSGLENPQNAALQANWSSGYSNGDFLFLNINNSSSGFLGFGAEL